MKLEVVTLRATVTLMQAGGITELEWEHQDGRIRLVLDEYPSGNPVPSQEVFATASAPGCFLTEHPMRDGALAPVGAVVAQGDVLGLVQAAVTFTAVTAPCDGTVLRQLVPPGTLVGHGTPVVALRKRTAT